MAAFERRRQLRGVVGADVGGGVLQRLLERRLQLALGAVEVRGGGAQLRRRELGAVELPRAGRQRGVALGPDAVDDRLGRREELGQVVLGAQQQPGAGRRVQAGELDAAGSEGLWITKLIKPCGRRAASCAFGILRIKSADSSVASACP